MKGKKEKNKKGLGTIDKNVIFSILGCLFAACMLFMNMHPYNYKAIDSAGAYNYIYEVIQNLSSSFDNVFFQITIVCAVFIFLSRKIAALEIKRLRLSRIFSLFVAVMWTFGKAFSIDNDLNLLVCSGGQIVKSIIFFWGSYFLADNLIHLLWYFLERRPDFKINQSLKKNGKVGFAARVLNFWDNHPFAFPFVFLLVVWAPYIIVSYPAVMCNDAFTELFQYFGLSNFTSHHPPIYTIMLGIFVSLGKTVFNSSNAGIFLYIILQYIACAAVMSYTLFVMKKLTAPKWLLILSAFVYGFMPIYISVVALTVKDTLYSMAVVLFVTQTILMLTKKSFRTVGNIILLAVSIIFSDLLRNNGKFVVFPAIAVLVVIFIKDSVKKKISVKSLCGWLAILLIPIILSTGVTKLVTKVYNIDSGSFREVLSLPFQQTARYVRDYKDEVTPEEKEAINAILDYEHLDKLYNEKISDPVKATYKPKQLDSDAKSKLIEYFKVWFAQFLKHPICYFEATLNQNYYLVYPFIDSSKVYEKTIGVNLDDNPSKAEKYEKIGITEFEPFTDVQHIFTDLYKLTARLPFLNLLCSNAFYTLIMLCILIYAINKKRYKILIISIPLIMSLLVIIASPVIASHPRYAFPISYSIPIFLACYLYMTDKRNEGTGGDPPITA